MVSQPKDGLLGLVKGPDQQGPWREEEARGGLLHTRLDLCHLSRASGAPGSLSLDLSTKALTCPPTSNRLESTLSRYLTQHHYVVATTNPKVWEVFRPPWRWPSHPPAGLVAAGSWLSAANLAVRPPPLLWGDPVCVCIC